MKIKMDISIFETQFNKCFGIYSVFIYIFSNLIKNQEKQQIYPVETPIENTFQFATGGTHNCAMKNGDMKCFGYNYYGQLGLGDMSDRGDKENEMGINLPLIQFPDNRKVDWVSCGSYYSCVVFTDRNATCFVLVVILLDSLV